MRRRRLVASCALVALAACSSSSRSAAPTTTTTAPSPRPPPASTTTTQGTSGVAVTLERIDGGGHTGPGPTIDVPRLGANTTSSDATNEFLDFVQAH